MTSYNDITGRAQKTKGATDPYRDGWERVFGNKKVPTLTDVVELPAEPDENETPADPV